MDGGATWTATTAGLIPDTPSPLLQVNAFVLDPRNGGTVYASTWYGVFKSTDFGDSWHDVSTGLKGGAFSGLAIDPQNPDTLYAGSSDFQPVSEIYKSTDGAAHWTASGAGLRATAVSGVWIDPTDPATLYANFNNSIVKSTDAGTTWNPLETARLLAVDPHKPATLYLVDKDGLERSTDGGKSWSALNDGLPSDSCHAVMSLAFERQKTETLYAGVSSGLCSNRAGGVWKSADGGESWAKLDSQPEGGGVHALVVDPNNSDTLYAWNGRGLFRSTDAGQSWSAGLTSGYVYTMAIDPQDSSTLYLINGLGLYKSSDRGANWSLITSGLPGVKVNSITDYRLAALVIDPGNPSTIYVGTGFGVFQSTDAGESWHALNAGLTAPDVRTLTIDPLHPATLYAGTAGGVFAITLTTPAP
jgi:photosystem II stability/assembly factor-like uncharacterized protein